MPMYETKGRNTWHNNGRMWYDNPVDEWPELHLVLPEANPDLYAGAICTLPLDEWPVVRCWTDCPVRDLCQAEHEKLSRAYTDTHWGTSAKTKWIPGVWGGIRYPDTEA